MDKTKNIQAYCKKSGLTRDDMKDMILKSALELGCNCSKMIKEDEFDAETIFFTLDAFNNLLDNVE